MVNYKQLTKSNMQVWKLLKETTVFKNKFVTVNEQTYKLPNGAIAPYYIKDGMGDVVSILAMNKERLFILAREFRPGPGKIIDELAGGIIDDNETPEKAAHRELLEETGYIGEMIYLGKSYISAYAKSIKHHYLALNCTQIKPTAGMNHENEFIEVVLKSKKDFQEQISAGELTDLDNALLGLSYIEKNNL